MPDAPEVAQSYVDGVARIFSASNVLKVLWTVVRLVTVNMVDLHTLWGRPLKRLRDETMHELAGWLPAHAYMDAAVSVVGSGFR